MQQYWPRTGVFCILKKTNWPTLLQNASSHPEADSIVFLMVGAGPARIVPEAVLSSLSRHPYGSMSEVGIGAGLACAIATAPTPGAILLRNASISIADVNSETPVNTRPPRKLPVHSLIAPIR